MITQAKLTDTQTTVLKAAISRPDGNIEPLPSNLRGGARTAVIDGLLARGLVAESDGGHLLTDAGYAAVGKRRPIAKDVQNVDAPDAFQQFEATSPTIRPDTKLAAIIHAMRHPGGATIAQMMAGTGWHRNQPSRPQPGRRLMAHHPDPHSFNRHAARRRGWHSLWSTP